MDVSSNMTSVGYNEKSPEGPQPSLTVEEANTMTEAEFRSTFANVVECCPEVASALATKRPFTSVQEMAAAAAALVQGMPEAVRVRVLLMHPELGGRLASEGRLTPESQREQRVAGVLQLTSSDTQRLRSLTRRYRERFGFPYVACVRELGAEGVLEDLSARVERTRDAELHEGIRHVTRICALRLRELVSEPQA